MKKITSSDLKKALEYKKLFDPLTRMDIININSGNTITHELAKCLICIRIARRGEHFLTEASFTYKGKKGRADIVNCSRGTIVEVRDSESKTACLSKHSYYPLKVADVEAKVVLDGLLL
jgi:hypothetical protein